MNYRYYLLIFFSFIFFGCSEDTIDDFAKGTLTGTVRLEADNEPLKNVKISTTPASITVFTDEEGNFEIANTLPLGDFSVRAELKGYITEYQSISITHFEQKVHIVFEMLPDDALNEPPSVPKMISPANMAVDLPNYVDLEWSCTDPDGDPLTYKLIFTNNRTNKRIELPNLETTKTTMSDLDFGTTYTWQVVASDSINDDVYSEAFQFTIRENPEYRYHFVRKNLGNFTIMATNLSEEIFITPISKQTWRPVKSNTANTLAYLQNYNGQTHLFTSSLDGHNEKKISQVPLGGFRSEELSFAWKADGSEILFPSFDKLYLINRDGTGQRQIFKTSDGHFISKVAWSNDGSKIAIVTTNINGYEAKIMILNANGSVVDTILQNVNGAVGGIDFDITGSRMLYTHDVSGNEDWQYRQLDTRIFMYDFTTAVHTDISSKSSKPTGSIDLDPRFSPDNSTILFTNTANDLLSATNVYSIHFDNDDTRNLLITNAQMIDFR